MFSVVNEKLLSLHYVVSCTHRNCIEPSVLWPVLQTWHSQTEHTFRLPFTKQPLLKENERRSYAQCKKRLLKAAKLFIIPPPLTGLLIVCEPNRWGIMTLPSNRHHIFSINTSSIEHIQHHFINRRTVVELDYLRLLQSLESRNSAFSPFSVKYVTASYVNCRIHAHMVTTLSHRTSWGGISILRSIERMSHVSRDKSNLYCQNFATLKHGVLRNASTAFNHCSACGTFFRRDLIANVFPWSHLRAASWIFFGSSISESLLSIRGRKCFEIEVLALKRLESSALHPKYLNLFGPFRQDLVTYLVSTHITQIVLPGSQN